MTTMTPLPHSDNVDWLKMMKFIISKLMDQPEGPTLTLVNSSKLTVVTSTGLRSRRLYRGDTLRWSSVRRRRGGGLVFVMDQVTVNTPHVQALFNTEGVTGAECDYAQLCARVGDFSEIFVTWIGHSYEQLMEQFVLPLDAQDRSKRAPRVIAVAPALTRDTDPHWGTW